MKVVNVMTKYGFVLFALLACSACERVTHDPTYHDPVASAQFKGIEKPDAAKFNSDREYKDALSKYYAALETKRGLGFMPMKCMNGACNRVNKYNAGVETPLDAPQYSFQIDPNLPAAE